MPPFLRAMADGAAHRGPDGVGSAVRGPVALGCLHRWETPEQVGETQPLESPDGRYLLVADARIDNRRELLAELATGPVPLTAEDSDARYILAAGARWGPACPDHLVGDFAFALWDGAEERLLLARDPVGARPLCYALLPGEGQGRSPGQGHGPGLRFASEIGQLLATGEVPAELDGHALLELLELRFHAPERTAWAGVQKVLPGHLLVADRRGLRTERWWRPERCIGSRGTRPEAEWVESCAALLERAVSDRLRSTSSRAAVMTSGGLDSSSVAALAQGCWQRSGGPRPLAVVEHFDRLAECDERAWSEPLLDALGMEVEWIQVERHRGMVMPREARDEPALLHGRLTEGLFERLEARSSRLVLTGFGGDSLFDGARLQPWDLVRTGRWHRLGPWIRASRDAGRSWLRATAAVMAPPLLPEALRRALDRRLGLGRYWHRPAWLTPPSGLRVQSGESHLTGSRRRIPQGRKAFPGVWAPLGTARGMVQGTALGVARRRQLEHILGLAQQGRAIEAWEHHGARAGVTVAHPLLDRRLAELVLAAPLELGARPGAEGTKWLLRRAMEGRLPKVVGRRPGKRGWGALFQLELCKAAGESSGQMFHDSRLAALGLIDEQHLLEALDRQCRASGPVPGPIPFLITLLVERWLRSLGQTLPTLVFRDLARWQGTAPRGDH